MQQYRTEGMLSLSRAVGCCILIGMEGPIWADTRKSRKPIVFALIAIGLAIAAMYRFVPDAPQYYSAIVNHTITLLAGCGATVVLGMLEKYIFKKPISFEWELAVLLAFVFFAGFQAWQDQYKKADTEHRARLAAEDVSTPKLVAKINMVVVGKNSKQQTVVSLIMTIVNHGAPSIANVNHMSVLLKDGKEVTPLLVIPTGKDIHLERDKEPEMILLAKDYLPEKAISSPIPKGGAVYGWMMYMLPGISNDEMDTPGGRIAMEFSDVDGRTFTATRTTPLPADQENK